MTAVKTCRGCGESKPVTEFYKRRQSADGYLNKCKKCACFDLRQRRQKNIDKVRAYERERRKNGARKYVYKYKKIKLTEKQIAMAKISNARYREKNKDKIRAQWKINHEIRTGRILRQSCEACGAQKAQAHHDDYSKPLDVRWLCSKCHGAHHRNERQKNKAMDGQLDAPAIDTV